MCQSGSPLSVFQICKKGSWNLIKELLPKGSHPVMASLGHPYRTKCHLRNLPRASLLIEVGSQDKPTLLQETSSLIFVGEDIKGQMGK